MRKSISIVHKYFLSGCDLDSAPILRKRSHRPLNPTVKSKVQIDSQIMSLLVMACQANTSIFGDFGSCNYEKCFKTIALQTRFWYWS